MKETFIWIGPSGLNPLVGQVIKGMTIIISDKQTQETLLNAGLINPANSQPLSRKKDDRRKAKKEECTLCLSKIYGRTASLFVNETK